MKKNRLRIALMSVGLAVLAVTFQNCSKFSDNNSNSSRITSKFSYNSVKWHPGHYWTIAPWGKNDPKYLLQVYNELKSVSPLRGVHIRYYWSELEKAEDVYDFSQIENRLEELKAIKKHLVIQVQTKSFWEAGNQDKLIPDYLKNSLYEGGAFTYSDFGTTNPDGENIKLWNTHVRDRLIKLMQELGARFNNEPNFEAVVFIETALGQPIVPFEQGQIATFFDNLIEVNRQTKIAFPNTVVFQQINYPVWPAPNQIEKIANALKSFGVGLSCPDVFSDEEGLNQLNGNYFQFNKMAGVIPIGPEVMHKNYLNTNNSGTGHVPTIEELFLFAKNTLKSNYIFWTRNSESATPVLNELSKAEYKNDYYGSGGLAFSCPQAFSSCYNF